MKALTEIKGFGACSYFPAFLNLREKRCVVVGGGEVALRKVKTILTCGGKVTVISPTLHPELGNLLEMGLIQWVNQEYDPKTLQGAILVVAATDKKEINREVAQKARTSGSLVNVADDVENSDFIVPSFFQRGSLILAISTSGKSPALSKKIREILEVEFGEEYAELVSLVEEVRSELKRMKKPIKSEDWQRSLDLNMLKELLKKGEREKAKASLLDRLKTFCRSY